LESVASSLARWLASRSVERLAALLARRPETLVPPAPLDLSELAHRLQSRVAVAGALQSMPLPAVQAIEAARAFDCRDRASLAKAMHLAPEDLDEALSMLSDAALAWELDGELHLSAPLRDGLRHPLGLGPPAEVLLAQRTAAELRAIASALGCENRSRKHEVLRAVCDALGDGVGLRALVASAPAPVRKLLGTAAWHGPVVALRAVPYRGEPDWATRHGVLVSDGWQHLTMPREVALALRGPDWRPPFTPAPPDLRLAAVDPAAVEREASAAAAAAVDAVSTLLAAVAHTPVAVRKAGGIGAREQRRLAKVIGADEATVRLWLELAYTAGLLAPSAEQVLLTPAYDEWLAGEPADRLVPLLAAWWLMPTVPLQDGSVPLVRELVGRLGGELRQKLLQSVVGIPSGRRIVDERELGPVLHWRLPLLIESFAEPEEYVRPLWTEGSRLGVLAHGAPTELAAALVAGDPEALRAAARKLLDDAVPQAIFQADLTAVVPGIPAGALAGLLDAVADRESRGNASTWRFSATSVRRALDTGRDADGLTEELRSVAVGGTLPQALEYLLRDVARGHGRVRVRSVNCVVRADDPALLAEIAATRSLSRLSLVLLAPTVLGSACSVTETLAALRTAGYAPVGEEADGQPKLERVPTHRTPTGPARPPAKTAAAAHAARADPLALATTLLAAPVGPAARTASRLVPAGEPVLWADDEELADPAASPHPHPPDTLDSVAAHATRLNPAEQRLLAYAIDTRTPVEIHYTNGQGGQSVRVIEEIELTGGVIEAWCRLREDERMFMLDRIDAVAPA
jgi:Helicase conserved C-terminal domain